MNKSAYWKMICSDNPPWERLVALSVELADKLDEHLKPRRAEIFQLIIKGGYEEFMDGLIEVTKAKDALLAEFIAQGESADVFEVIWNDIDNHGLGLIRLAGPELAGFIEAKVNYLYAFDAECDDELPDDPRAQVDMILEFIQDGGGGQ